MIENETFASRLQRRGREAQATFNKALTGEFLAIRQATDESHLWNIRHFHELGQRLAQIKAEPRKYGRRAMKLIADAINDDDGVMVKRAIDFYEWLPDPVQLEELLARRGPTGNCLCWGAMFVALTAPEEERNELLNLALQRQLTMRDLHDEIKRRATLRREKQKGHDRRAAPPEDLQRSHRAPGQSGEDPVACSRDADGPWSGSSNVEPSIPSPLT